MGAFARMSVTEMRGTILIFTSYWKSSMHMNGLRTIFMFSLGLCFPQASAYRTSLPYSQLDGEEIPDDSIPRSSLNQFFSVSFTF
jgi:hypothetical protein